MIKVKKAFEGKGTRVHVQIRPGYARTILIDKATEKELERLHAMKHPAVMEEKAPKPAK